MSTHPISLVETEQHSLAKSIAYHLFPGIIAFLCVLFFTPLLIKSGLTIGLALNLALFLSIVPVQLGLLLYTAKKQTGRFTLEGILPYRQKLPLRQYFIWVPALLGWIILVFFLLEPVGNYLLQYVFNFFPAGFNPAADVLSRYSSGMLLASWASDLILLGIFVPIVEEFYFRGYLLPRLSRYRGASVFINVVLFAVYHFFSPWMAITRIIAIFPMCFIVWRTKNIYVGMAVHVLLNLISSLSQYNLYMG
ncbi:hypothetical protein H70357_27205 [Paenibacillus sp. FSL H7-0357]|uniref:CPBP family intramembrane glutamic endopeptidase n=1 Tax=Paenibacillus sp. FSL H7-0357 TaxID=1536774 RepID=UPI0004F60B36|nr:type II CAAX endopeptidase family protein [Paenibacillus sp. FSL H7-0357]AIQ19988.1 hypothetical protein H70357_27205 [Paenibacillus sp. FSL H7-0357]